MAEEKKTTTRTPRSRSKKINDAEGLKDTQQVNQIATEELGGSASPGSALYQTKQFDVAGPVDVLDSMATPPADAVAAKEASDNHYKNYGKDNG